MLALTTNFLAFYLGAIYIERCGIFCGVAVFLLTSLAGTIMASKVERYVFLKIHSAFSYCGDRIARYSAERHYLDR